MEIHTKKSWSDAVGLGLGILAAVKKNKWQDHTISTLVMVFVSVPSYVYAFLVQYILLQTGLVRPSDDTSFVRNGRYVFLVENVCKYAYANHGT